MLATRPIVSAHEFRLDRGNVDCLPTRTTCVAARPVTHLRSSSIRAALGSGQEASRRSGERQEGLVPRLDKSRGGGGKQGSRGPPGIAGRSGARVSGRSRGAWRSDSVSAASGVTAEAQGMFNSTGWPTVELARHWIKRPSRPADSENAGERQRSVGREALGRRLVFTSLSCGVLAEGLGQVIDPDGALRQHRRHRHETASTSPPEGDIVNETAHELMRAGQVSGLAAIGALGAQYLRHAANTCSVSEMPTRSTTRTQQSKVAMLIREPGRALLSSKVASFRPNVENLAINIVFAAFYGGLFQPHWFNFLNEVEWHKLLPEGVIPGSLEPAEDILMPLMINQLVMIPVLYWPSFFFFRAAVKGWSDGGPGEVTTSLCNALPRLMRSNLSFWVPAQSVQFASVPPERQAVYVAAMGILWNGVMAFLTSAPDKQAAAAEAAQAEVVAKEEETAPVVSVGMGALVGSAVAEKEEKTAVAAAEAAMAEHELVAAACVAEGNVTSAVGSAAAMVTAAAVEEHIGAVFAQVVLVEQWMEEEGSLHPVQAVVGRDEVKDQ